MQVAQPVMWPAATRAVSAREGVTHLLDFGPGGAAGTAGLSARMLAERGDGAVTVVLASATTMEDVAPEGSRCDAMRCDAIPLPRAHRRRRRRRRLFSLSHLPTLLPALVSLCGARRPGFAGMKQLLQGDPSAVKYGAAAAALDGLGGGLGGGVGLGGGGGGGDGAAAAVAGGAGADFWGVSNVVAMSVASVSGDSAASFGDDCVTIVTDA
jgi:hypothetical protein